jgi:hypothetical protein
MISPDEFRRHNVPVLVCAIAPKPVGVLQAR